MAQITDKELSALADLLAMEQNLVVKYQTYASETHDNALRNRYESIAQRHQRHFDELYTNLK